MRPQPPAASAPAANTAVTEPAMRCGMRVVVMAPRSRPAHAPSRGPAGRAGYGYPPSAAVVTMPRAVDASPFEDLVVITGFSGAGKSTAMNVFEDAGYFCVDNLPPEMIRGLVDLFRHPGSKVELAAVVCDVRGGEFFEGLIEVLEELEEVGVPDRVLFLDADEGTLL